MSFCSDMMAFYICVDYGLPGRFFHRAFFVRVYFRRGRGVIFWGVIFRGVQSGNKLMVHFLEYRPIPRSFIVRLGLLAMETGSHSNLNQKGNYNIKTFFLQESINNWHEGAHLPQTQKFTLEERF